MALQDDIDALKAAVATLTTEVSDVNTNVVAVLAKLATAGNITPEQVTDLETAIAALQAQNTALQAVDDSLKAALP